uniref:Uncharacterized protein n=1 Tax=viral metagenome TaxID=1070528 RepID=A0A6C0BC08_9ZZZZ
MGDEFKLYIIYTSYGLEEISEILRPHIKSGFNIGPFRKDFTRDKNNVYHESNRRFVLMKESIYLSLKESGYEDKENNDFSISEYEIRNENQAPRDSLMHFYFPSNPNNKLSVQSKMKYIDETGMINPEDYFVHDGIVEFSNRVSDQTRTIIKIAIDERNCRVSWCKRFAFRNLKRVF